MLVPIELRMAVLRARSERHRMHGRYARAKALADEAFAQLEAATEREKEAVHAVALAITRPKDPVSR